MTQAPDTSAETTKRPRRLRRVLVVLSKAAFLLVAVSAVGLVSARMWLVRSYVPSGPPPQGYGSLNEMYVALMLESTSLIERQPAVPPEIRYDPGITYARVGDQELKLDVYRSASADTAPPRPLLVLIHGGGWKSGKREDYRAHALKVAGAGYVVASLSYRLSGVATFPAAIRDVNAALQFLADHADEYGIDPEKIVVMGGSAGGHLAMLAGYARVPEFDPQSDPDFRPIRATGQEPKSFEIVAVFNFYGPCDLSTEFAQAQGVVKSFLGGTYEEKKAAYESASPLRYVSADAPPTLIVHGTLDDIVPVEQSDTLVDKLRKSGVPVRYVRLTGWPHTMDLAEPVFRYLTDVIRDELAKVVGEGAETH